MEAASLSLSSLRQLIQPRAFFLLLAASPTPPPFFASLSLSLFGGFRTKKQQADWHCSRTAAVAASRPRRPRRVIKLEQGGRRRGFSLLIKERLSHSLSFRSIGFYWIFCDDETFLPLSLSLSPLFYLSLFGDEAATASEEKTTGEVGTSERNLRRRAISRKSLLLLPPSPL